MPNLSNLQNVETSRAAALQAEFNEKKWVWVPDAREGYLAGWVNEEEEDAAQVIMAAGGELRRVPFEALFKMNPPKFDRAADIADLTFLNEASVVHNLRLRYGSGSIYTYSGLFLVAVNPYQNLPLYSDTIIQQYRGKRRDDNPPHIFAVAERAWVNMGEERENQSILITGESGAGKTESTKKVIQYLASIATDVHPPSTPSHSRSNTLITTMSTGFSRSTSKRRSQAISPSMSGGGSHLTAKGRLGLLERQILQANPILEAFGNAQTQRNNNSSRFGKFVRIMFAPDGSIAGANIDWYLLEKSRVVTRNEAERSFHVFYQLMASEGTLKEDLLLNGEVEDYEYLNKSRREVDGVDDREEWNSLQAALDVVGFDTTEQFDLFRVVAAILHIGNIVITSTRSDDAVMSDPSQAERVCHLLGIPIAEFTRAVLRPRALAGREWVTQARTRQQALDELSALCKTLYEKSFGSLVDRINRALDRPSSKSTFIGVLDIAGFEIFEINAYEQLLINYTNEKLQQFFNHHMFVLEQEEYAREHIQWDYLNFGLDLQPTIDLIESSGNAIGILSCLDEECIMPKASDLTFTNKLHTIWASQSDDDEVHHPGRDKYEPSRFEQGFIIDHYAARVEYRTDGWLEKNKDPLNDNLTRVLAASSERYVANLFADYADLPSGPIGASNAFTVGKKRTTKKGAFRTVAQRHKEQLHSLMLQLQATQPHFVRCIVPNSHKKPGRIDVPLVLDQLRCNGVLEGIRIARLGYPNRLPFVEFRQRYEILTPGIIPRGYMDGREACKRMVAALDLDEMTFKIGTSKIFFKAGCLAELEEQRHMLLFRTFSGLQAVARMWTARRQMKKILNRAVAIKTIQRNARVYGDLREWPWWQLYTKVRPLLAATRNDEELQRKEVELALVKEKAERDKQEREALETLKMSLEAEKRRVEDELEAERTLVLEKDALLERSTKREAKLEDDIVALQADIDVLDSQLDRAMKLQKESEEKHESLRRAFDQAAEHLVRLEAEQKEWKSKETTLSAELESNSEEVETLRSDLDEMRLLSEQLKNLVLQREEDLLRSKERTDLAIKELEGKLDVELRNKELIKDKSDHLENDARHAKEQLAELGRTTNEYSNMIQKKEDQISLLTKQLETLKQERDSCTVEIMQLRADVDTLDAELNAEKLDHAKEFAFREKLQGERDEMRALLNTKTTEETRREEVERSKERELVDLRHQINQLHQELTDLRQSSLETQTKLKLDLEQSNREHISLQHSHKSLLDRERSAQSQLARTQGQLSELEKAGRAMDSEFQSVKSRQNDIQSELSEALRVKEGLERQLATAQGKYQNFEDVVLEFQRDQETRLRDLETARKQLESETAKRMQLEKASSNQKAEIAKLKDRNTKLDRELNKALNDLKAREWDVKQLLSKQDKTIVEHVHVLEEAKRVTDGLLQEARLELKRNEIFIRSLQSAKSKMASEAEDMAVKNERELRAKEKEVKVQQEKVTQTFADVEKERQGKEEAELQIRRLQYELQQIRHHAEDVEGQLLMVQQSKTTLEDELDRLAAEAESGDSPAKLQRQYEARIAHLEQQRVQLRESTQAKKQLQAEVNDLKEQLELAKTAASKSRKKLQKQLQDDQVSLSTSSAAQSELRAMVEAYKEKDSALQKRCEAAEIAQAKASTGEQHARRLVADLEKLREQDTNEFKRALQAADQRIRTLEAEMDKEGRESSEMTVLCQRLAEELEDDREQHQKDLAERDFTIDQTRKKYQAELAQLSEELQSQRDALSRLREDNRKLRSDYDELQLQYDDEVYNSGGWRKEKERMETKITDLEKVYEASTGAQTEQQSQIIALHSQVRELRGVLDDAEADRALLQKARRALQAELETIKLDHVDTNKMTSGQEFQRLQLKKQDLERSLEEQEDRVSNAFDRMKKAESFANECQIELGKVRVENSELDKLNANLEKQLKELNVRIVDLETKSYATLPRTGPGSRRMDSRIEELTNQLHQGNTDKGDRSSVQRSPAKSQHLEADRQKAKIESYETHIESLRKSMDAMQTKESHLQTAKRRAEREAVDYKQRVLGLERELERLHSRLERPTSSMERTSPLASDPSRK